MYKKFWILTLCLISFHTHIFAAFELEFTEEDLGFFHYINPLSEIEKKLLKARGSTNYALQLARAYYLWQSKKNDEAVTSLKALVYVKNFPLIDYARFTLGSIYLEQKMLNNALFHFKKIDENTWALKEDLWLSLSNIYFWKNQFDLAEPYFEKYVSSLQAKALPLSQEERQEKFFYPRWRWAQVLEKTNIEKALLHYKDILTSFPDENQRIFKNKIRELSRKLKIKFEIPAEFYFKIARSEAHIRNYESAKKNYLLYLQKSKPLDPFVYDTLVDLQRIYKLEKNIKEQKHYARLLSLYKHEEKPIYQHELVLAKIHWNEEDLQKALNLAFKVARNAPHPFRNEAYFILAKIYAQRQDLQKALEELSYINPQNKKEMEEKLYYTAWYYFRLRKFGEAHDWWMELVNTVDKPDYFLASHYWAMQSIKKIKGVKNSAKNRSELFEKIFEKDPFSYYSYLGQYELSFKKMPRGKKIHFVIKDEASNYYQLDQNKLLQLKLLLHTKIYPFISKHSIDLFKNARSELSPELELFKAFTMASSGNYLETFLTLNKTLSDPEKKKNIPDFTYTLLYPRAYWDVVQKVAKKHGLSPYLLLSIVRQESAYNHKARSSADAMGLLQILPETGRIVAKGSGKEINLFDPYENLDLGAQLISTHYRKYNKNLIDTLAAYNAGEDIVLKWKSSMKKNVDTREYIELIPYQETRNYIKLILRNFNNYLYLYEKKRLPYPSKLVTP